MQVFKRKTFKRIYSVLSLAIMIFVAYSLITNTISNYSYSYSFNKDYNKIKQGKETVDIAFVGASRLQRSMVPSVFEDKMSLSNVLVCSTASQPISGSYYYIKQLIKDVHPKKIVLDVTWDRLINESQTQASLLVYDRLTGLNKLDYVLNCFDESNRCYILGPCRYKENLLNLKTIRRDKKVLKEYGYDPQEPTGEVYTEKGFIKSKGLNTTGSITYNSDDVYFFSAENILDENRKYLDKCVAICEENGIEIELISAPCSLTYIYYVEGYDDATNWYKNYAKEKSINYINLNYIKEREEILPDELMSDLTHTSGKGAYVVSDIYADLLLKEKQGVDLSTLLYDNLDELKKDVHRIVALETKIEFLDTQEEGVSARIFLSSLRNADSSAYYKIEIKEYDNDEIILLSQWSEAETFDVVLPSRSGFQLIVTAKSQYEDDKPARMIYDF